MSISELRTHASKPANRALVISLDGLDARYLERRDEFGLRIPTLRRLIESGVSAQRVVPVYPSVTYPVHASIATGAYPIKHGILGNWLFEPPDRKQTGDWHWFARDIKADTLWDAARRGGMKTGIVSWPVAAGAGDYCVPEMLLPTFTNHEARQRMVDHSRPLGIIEECERLYPDLYRLVTRDEHDDLRTQFAEHIIAAFKPDLMMIHLFDFDHWQHDFAPFSTESFEMLEKIDAYVARILGAAERAGTLEESAVFIVSDHGFVPISKLFHPIVALRECGMITIENGGVVDWRAIAYMSGCSCSIILQDQSDDETRRRLRTEFTRLAQTKDSGIKRVFERDEILAMGANPDAALMLEADDDFAFGFNFDGEVVTASVQRGQHGHHPDGQSAVFIAAGMGIAKQDDLEMVQIIDVGPTIASVLGLELRDADGVALLV